MMTILLVEDELHVHYFIWKLLKADGFTVLTAGDGEAALEKLRKHPNPVDLVVTDMGLPRLNGFELYRQILVERPGTKVILMSGDLAVREQCEMAGLPFFQKPFLDDALQQVVRAVIGSPR